MRTIFLYIFLIFNCINLQYVPGMLYLNNFITKIRMQLLRLAGADIDLSSILRPNSLVISPRRLKIGSETIIGPNAKIMNFETVTIGNQNEIGPNITFQTNEHVINDYSQPLGKQGVKYSPIVIGNGCYFGSDVTILSGVKITDRCLVGAKSLVNKDLSVPGLYGGSPVRLIRKF